ncbi:MAG: hypothetical protein J1E34_00230 [Oscillospiraceae bacterium]|nr:hypothetical protein [Oscillospiraceae bacterium]
MKNAFVFIIVIAFLLSLCSCGGNVKNVEIIAVESDLFSKRDIASATRTAVKYFEDEFEGCTLKKIQYIGDDEAESFKEWANQYGADEAIVLVSTFYVELSGSDGSLEPGQTYENWQWVLVRNSGGSWRHVTHGYA